MSRRVGVVLAGGKATRLNHKLLLTTQSGEPVVVSACRYLISQGVDQVVVSYNHPSVRYVVELCIENFDNKVIFVEDERQEGINAAIFQVVESVPSDYYLIVCGDNVYPMGEALPQMSEFVVTRRVGENLARNLSVAVKGASGIEYCGRDTRNSFPPEKVVSSLSTPWQLSTDSLSNLHPLGTIEWFLTTAELPSMNMSADGWYDLGTEESFEAYWRHVCSS